MKTVMTLAEWQAEGRRRFGEDSNNWKFVCPICGRVASAQDWRDAGADDGEIAFSCIGRRIDGSREAFGHTGPGPCNYTGGGLFALNPIAVNFPNGLSMNAFAFADPEELKEDVNG